jgi:hypothetical protein
MYTQRPENLLQRSFLDESDLLKMGQERLRRLGNDVQDTHTSLISASKPPIESAIYLEVLDEPF